MKKFLLIGILFALGACSNDSENDKLSKTSESGSFDLGQCLGILLTSERYGYESTEKENKFTLEWKDTAIKIGKPVGEICKPTDIQCAENNIKNKNHLAFYKGYSNGQFSVISEKNNSMKIGAFKVAGCSDFISN